jgi:hypothetical protein
VPDCGEGKVFAMLDLGMQVLKWLAVVGGATVGGWGSGFLFRLVVRLSLWRSPSSKVLMPIRILGALAVGLAVWVWAFSSGEFGPGMGGWLGPGKSDGQSPEAKTEPGVSSQQSAERQPGAAVRSPPLQPDQGRDTLRIEILGGARVKQERFYLLEGENRPRTLPEVRKAIQARQQEADKPRLKGIVILVYPSSVARDHPAVKNLVNWAKENRLSVTFPPTNGAGR